MKKINVFLILFFLVFCLKNLYATSMEEARNQALDLGSNGNSSFKMVSEENKKSVPGYITDEPKETKYFSGENLDRDAQDKMANSEEGKLLTQSLPRKPKMDLSHADTFLNQSKAIERNPDEVINMMTGNYEQCKAILEEVPQDLEIKTCDEYEERTANSCFTGQLVNIDDSHKYKCNLERKFKDKSCDKNLKLTCQSSSTCSKNIGIATVSGEDAIYNYPSLNVNISWRGGSCSVYSKITNISISNPELIDSFILANISWDDSVEVKINGNVIYKNWYGCERGTVYSASPNADLKKYLVKGNNILELKLLVSGMGFASTQYLLKQKCCTSWKENWEEICQN